MRNNLIAKELEDTVRIQNIVRLKIVFASFLMFVRYIHKSTKSISTSVSLQSSHFILKRYTLRNLTTLFTRALANLKMAHFDHILSQMQQFQA